MAGKFRRTMAYRVSISHGVGGEGDGNGGFALRARENEDRVESRLSHTPNATRRAFYAHLSTLPRVC